MDFNASSIKPNNLDLSRGIILPKRMSVSLSELIGIHLGDGSIYKDGKYTYSISYAGNLTLDKEYMRYIEKLIVSLFSLNPKRLINKSMNSYTLRIRSKTIYLFMVSNLKLPEGPKKHLVIPKFIKNNKEYAKSFLRGLFDTDGCFTIQRTNGYSYPLIKLTTNNKEFADDIKKLLYYLGFDSFISTKKSIRLKKMCVGYDVVLKGYKKIDKWKKEIGSSNPRKFKKMGTQGFEP